MRAASRSRRAVTVTAAVVGVLAVGLGGSLLTPQQPVYRQSAAPAVGRTASVCPSVSGDADVQVAGVAIRNAPGRTGALAGTTIGGRPADIAITEQGRGSLTTAPAGPVVLRGEGAMATAASGMTVSTSSEGELAGLMAAPCTPAATQHWFVGVGASTDFRTRLVLANPDAGQAVVDLRFYGRTGLIVVPGSPGLVIDGNSARTIELDALLQAAGPLTVEVRADEGRVSAVALDRSSTGLDPVGADWQTSAAPPARQVVVPAVPEGEGSRQLTVVNPGSERATVSVAVLGVEGAFAPAGAEALVVEPESSASVELADGLAGQSAAIALTSDRPVTAAVLSRSRVTERRPDIAVQSASPAVVRTGVVPLATRTGADTQLTLSNAGPDEVTVSFEVLSYSGVRLRTEDVLLVPQGSATRRLTSPPPSYLVVQVPDGAQVYGGVAYAQVNETIAGLAGAPLTSPDVASRAPATDVDPTVGR